MKIGIIGAGMIGGTLARRLVALGHEVAPANSRRLETLRGLAREIGARPVTATEATPAYAQDFDAPRLNARLAAADRSRVPGYRRAANDAVLVYMQRPVGIWAEFWDGSTPLFG